MSIQSNKCNATTCARRVRFRLIASVYNYQKNHGSPQLSVRLLRLLLHYFRHDLFLQVYGLRWQLYKFQEDVHATLNLYPKIATFLSLALVSASNGKGRRNRHGRSYKYFLWSSVRRHPIRLPDISDSCKGEVPRRPRRQSKSTQPPRPRLQSRVPYFLGSV